VCGATSERCVGTYPIAVEQIAAGKELMRTAFVDLAAICSRAAVDATQLEQLSWRFFDGNQAVNEALSRLPGAAGSPPPR